VAGLAPWTIDAREHSRLRDLRHRVRVFGRHLRHHRQGRAARAKRRGYDEKTCLGSLAAAGTLGILLPPSIIMVVYAVAAEVSIIKVFLAGFIPGFVLTALFSGYIVIWALMNPEKTPPMK